MLRFQRLAEKIFVVMALIFYTGAIAPFFPPVDPLYPIIHFFPNVALAVTLLLIAARWKRVLNVVIREKFLWLVLAIAPASILWSDAPMVTLDSVIPLLRVTLFGVYFATTYSLKEQLRLLAWAFGTAALLSLVVCLVLPSRGVMGVGFISSMEDIVHTGKWRGIYIHKTELGSMMSLSATIFVFFLATTSSWYRWIMWAGFCLSVGLIVGSKTTGALIILVFVVVLIPLYRALRWNYTFVVPFFIILLLVCGSVATVILGNAEAIVSGLGKDITISGRTEIWPGVIDKIWARPWLGYGYRTFWVGGWEGEPADIWRTLRDGFQPPHSHNGPLELLLDSGFLGFSAFASSFLTVCLRSVTWVRLTKTAEGLVPLPYLTFMVLVNLTESYLMRADIYWLLYVALTLSMCNMSVNLAESNVLWQQQVKRASIKQIKQAS